MTRARPSIVSVAALGAVFAACKPGPASSDEDEAPLCRAPAPVDVDPLGDPAVCANYAPEEPAAALTVAFVNRLDDDVVLHGRCHGYFGALGAPGGRLALAPVSCLSDLPPCEWMLDADSSGCLATCPIAPSIRIAPGMRFEIEWRPLVMVEAELPAECAADPAFFGECYATRRPIPGDYLLRAMFSRASECVAGCDCEPGADGWCRLAEPPDVPVEALREIPALYDGVCETVEFAIE